jgi:hypothetical protein
MENVDSSFFVKYSACCCRWLTIKICTQYVAFDKGFIEGYINIKEDSYRYFPLLIFSLSFCAKKVRLSDAPLLFLNPDCCLTRMSLSSRKKYSIGLSSLSISLLRQLIRYYTKNHTKNGIFRKTAFKKTIQFTVYQLINSKLSLHSILIHKS